MASYKTVLIALDLDGYPDQVLAGAAKLIDATTKVHIINVAYDPAQFYANYGVEGFVSNVTITAAEQARTKARDKTRELVEQVDFVDAEICAELGRTQTMIVHKAEDLRADLIILGSHGRHGVGLLLGSTANAVLHHAKCDVLAVRVKDDVSTPEQ